VTEVRRDHERHRGLYDHKYGKSKVRREET
jgi:hypothetical protein